MTNRDCPSCPGPMTPDGDVLRCEWCNTTIPDSNASAGNLSTPGDILKRPYITTLEQARWVAWAERRHREDAEPTKRDNTTTP